MTLQGNIVLPNRIMSYVNSKVILKISMNDWITEWTTRVN